MFEARQNANGVKALRRHIGDQIKERTGWRLVQGVTRGIVHIHPPAAHFHRNPARQLAVGRDQCGRAVGVFVLVFKGAA